MNYKTITFSEPIRDLRSEDNQKALSLRKTGATNERRNMSKGSPVAEHKRKKHWTSLKQVINIPIKFLNKLLKTKYG